jgi:hypothetical protein
MKKDYEELPKTLPNSLLTTATLTSEMGETF